MVALYTGSNELGNQIYTTFNQSQNYSNRKLCLFNRIRMILSVINRCFLSNSKGLCSQQLGLLKLVLEE